jgi:manganese/zinc/iron transport system substrate-binding protein
MFEDLLMPFEYYQQRILGMKAELVGLLDSELPESRRILITSHDAFSYFGDEFGFRVEALQGISTAAEFGVKDVSDLITFIQINEVKSIFIETSISDKNLKAVVDGANARGYSVNIGGTLYSDALGGKGSGADSYEGMIRTNVLTIIEALK